MLLLLLLPQAAAGKKLHFTTTASGSVNWSEAASANGKAGSPGPEKQKPSKGEKGGACVCVGGRGRGPGWAVGRRFHPQWPQKHTAHAHARARFSRARMARR